jgi:hypothetical protein
MTDTAVHPAYLSSREDIDVVSNRINGSADIDQRCALSILLNLRIILMSGYLYLVPLTDINGTGMCRSKQAGFLPSMHSWLVACVPVRECRVTSGSLYV